MGSRGKFPWRLWLPVAVLVIGVGVCVSMPVPYELGIDAGMVGPDDVDILELAEKAGGSCPFLTYNNDPVDPDYRNVRLKYGGFFYNATIAYPRNRSGLMKRELLFSARLNVFATRSEPYRRIGDFYTLLTPDDDTAETRRAAEEFISAFHVAMMEEAGAEVTYQPRWGDFMEKLGLWLEGKMNWSERWRQLMKLL